MFAVFQIATLALAALAMAPAVAHALEFPGKRRLSHDAYLTVQPIYYPGFTIAGFAEIAGIVAALVLAWLTPRETPAFWLTLIAAILLLLMHVVFWIVTQPVNKVWLRDQKLGRAGETFFNVDRDMDKSAVPEWTSLRDRWEYSHVARAVLSFTAVLLLAAAISAP